MNTQQRLINIGLAAIVLGTCTSQAMGRPLQADSQGHSSGIIPLSNKTQSEILSRHNEYRSDLNLPALEWSSDLADDAKEWAQHLVNLGGKKLVHATYSERNQQGENLWMAPAGYFSHSQMVQTWGQERKNFKAGVFPNISKTGNWFHASHYSQIIWKSTTKVGCAQARAGGNDLLVCRYDPSGNTEGQAVY